MSQLIAPKRGPKGSDIGTVHSVAYHRNGVGGQGFYAVEFDLSNEGKTHRAHAVVINADRDTTDPLEAFVTIPGKPELAWRGTDCYGKALQSIVQASKWPHEVDAEKREAAKQAKVEADTLASFIATIGA